MARTERSNHKGPKNTNPSAARLSQISRSLTKLLRHQAENEKIPISPAGWVKMNDLLAWKGLERIEKGITITEMFEVVEEDGRTGKGRFEVKYIGDNDQTNDNEDDINPEAAAAEQETSVTTGQIVQATSTLAVTDPQTPTTLDPTSKNTIQTQSALSHHNLNPSTPPASYLIRAAQGHSIKNITNTETLTLLTLSLPTLPTTVVHGTFYGAWPSILATGGLKPMGRNNVHFATGPSLDEVTALVDQDSKAMKGKSQVEEVLSRNKVVSGMRWDAQLLIYIDLRGALEDVREKGLDMSWWISGNGVVLTEGVVVEDDEEEEVVDGHAAVAGESEAIIASESAKAQKESQISKRDGGKKRQKERVVPMKYWTTVVEIKNGVGVIWRRGEGVVKELPQRLRSMPMPSGKKGGSGGKRSGRGGRKVRESKGGKPELNIERGDIDGDEVVDQGEEE